MDVQIYAYQTPSGQARWKLQGRAGRRQWGRSFATEGAAKHWREIITEHGVETGLQMLEAALRGRQDARPLTVQEIVTDFITSRSGVTQGTKDGYASLTANHIVPFMGHDLAGMVDDLRIAEWITWMQGKGLGHSTMRRCQTLLSSAYKLAMKREKLTRNPAREADVPRGMAREMVCLELAEVGVLLGTIDPFYRDFVTVLVGTGMRFGEATALLVADVTIRPNGAEIRVSKSWQRAHRGPEKIGTTKTKKARTIPVDRHSWAYDALVRSVGKKAPGALLFVNKRHEHIRNATFTKNAWNPMRKKLQEEHGWHKWPRIHDMRHSFASLLLCDAGIPISAVSKLLGHAKVSMTVDVYGHLLNGAERDAMSRMGALMGGAPKLRNVA